MKQGVMRTVEALLAIALAFTILVFLFPDGRVTQEARAQEEVLHQLRSDIAFRSCVLEADLACINATLDARIEDGRVYDYVISSDVDALPFGLPDKEIVANSLFVAGNLTDSTSKVMRLYMWEG